MTVGSVIRRSYMLGKGAMKSFETRFNIPVHSARKFSAVRGTTSARSCMSHLQISV